MIGVGEMFTFFFVMLGPLKVLGPFAQRTREVDDATMKQIAVWAFVVATASVMAGGLIGRTLLFNWSVSLPAMTLSGGIVFFLVALRQLLEQYQPGSAGAPEPLPASPILAASRLVFPMVVTPYGIAAVIALLAASSDAARTTTILFLLLVVMLLDLLAMWFARRLVVGSTMIVLQVLGAVLAVLQVALSVQIILNALQQLRVIPV